MVHDIHAKFHNQQLIIRRAIWRHVFGYADSRTDAHTHTRTHTHTHTHTAGVQLVGHIPVTYVVYVEYKWCMLSIHSVHGVYLV